MFGCSIVSKQLTLNKQNKIYFSIEIESPRMKINTLFWFTEIELTIFSAEQNKHNSDAIA